MQQLEQTIADDEQPSENWIDASLSELCDHIVQTYHAYLKAGRESPYVSRNSVYLHNRYRLGGQLKC